MLCFRYKYFEVIIYHFLCFSGHILLLLWWQDRLLVLLHSVPQLLCSPDCGEYIPICIIWMFSFKQLVFQQKKSKTCIGDFSAGHAGILCHCKLFLQCVWNGCGHLVSLLLWVYTWLVKMKELFHYNRYQISNVYIPSYHTSMHSKCNQSTDWYRKKKEWASSHTPHSNIAWECCIQRMAISSISDRQSDRKPISSELHKIIFGQSSKGI